MNIRTALLCSALALLAASTRGDGTSVVVTPSFVSQYMFRGVRLGGAAFQPSVEVDSGNLAAGVWVSTPLKDKVNGQSDPEIDPYASYTLAINDSLNIAPGFTWYTYPKAHTSDGFYKSTFEPSIGLNYTVSGIKITPKLYYDVVYNGPTYELTVAYSVPLPDLGSELDFTAGAGTYIIKDSIKGGDPEVKNWGDYYSVGVAAPFTITKESKLTVGFGYTKGTGNYYKQGTDPKVQNSAAVGRGVLTVSYSYTF